VSAACASAVMRVSVYVCDGECRPDPIGLKQRVGEPRCGRDRRSPWAEASCRRVRPLLQSSSRPRRLLTRSLWRPLPSWPRLESSSSSPAYTTTTTTDFLL
jgi:hypothetical protein